MATMRISSTGTNRARFNDGPNQLTGRGRVASGNPFVPNLPGTYTELHDITFDRTSAISGATIYWQLLTFATGVTVQHKTANILADGADTTDLVTITGYLFGWANSGFLDETDLYTFELKMWSTDPGWT